MRKNSCTNIVFFFTFFFILAVVSSDFIPGIQGSPEHRIKYRWQNVAPVEFFDCYRVLPRIEIVDLDVIQWPLGGTFDYSLHWAVQNKEIYNVTVEFEYTMIVPDGSATTSSDVWELPAKMIFVCFMDFEYTSDLYGKYTYVLTIKDMGGIILDSKTVVWERER